MTLTDRQHQIATKLRQLADEAWEANEKILSTTLHGVAYNFERGVPTELISEELQSTLKTIREFSDAVTNVFKIK